MRPYIVLAKDADKDWYIEHGEVIASGGEAAIRKAIAGGLRAAKIVAVPKRNWTEREPEVVNREPVIRLKPVHPEQMSVEDVLGTADAVLAGSAPKP